MMVIVLRARWLVGGNKSRDDMAVGGLEPVR